MKKYLVFLFAVLIVTNVFGYALFRTNTYNQSTDFPDSVNHNGNLFGFQAPTVEGNWNGVYGGLALTRTGELTNTNDYLGNDRFMVFDGSNDYLSSDSASLNFNGNFSISATVEISDWANPAHSGVLSRHNGTSGWGLYLDNTSKTMNFSVLVASAETKQASVDVSRLPQGPHTFTVTREASYTHMYVDGVLLSKLKVSTSFPEAGNFEVGSLNGGDSKFTGSIQNVWLHNGVAWTPDQAKKIWARGSKLFATEKADGTLANIVSPLEGVAFLFSPGLHGTTSDPSGGTVTSTGEFSVSGNTVSISFNGSMKNGTNGVGTLGVYLPIAAANKTGLRAHGPAAVNYLRTATVMGLTAVGADYGAATVFKDPYTPLTWGTNSDNFDGTAAASPSYVMGSATYPWR